MSRTSKRIIKYALSSFAGLALLSVSLPAAIIRFSVWEYVRAIVFTVVSLAALWLLIYGVRGLYMNRGIINEFFKGATQNNDSTSINMDNIKSIRKHVTGVVYLVLACICFAAFIILALNGEEGFDIYYYMVCAAIFSCTFFAVSVLLRYF